MSNPRENWTAFRWPRYKYQETESWLTEFFLPQLLADVRSLTLRDQLKKRRVRAVRKLAMMSGGFLSFRPGEDFFTIIINERKLLLYSIETIGHEIAHTFGFYHSPYGGMAFSAIWPDGLINEKVEWLCDEFARGWLCEGNNRAEAEALVREVLANGEVCIF